MPITTEITPVFLRMTPSGRRRWVEIIAKKNVEQMKAGVDNTGAPLPKGVDLKESGDLQKKVSVDEDQYSFDTTYAEYVDARYHFAGLSDKALTEIEPALEEVANVEMYIEETEA